MRVQRPIYIIKQTKKPSHVLHCDKTLRTFENTRKKKNSFACGSCFLHFHCVLKCPSFFTVDKGVAERSPFCLLTIGPITSKGFFNYTQLATWNFVAQQVACGVVIRATKLCYLHSNNVAPQLARKCCRYYLALKHNLINKSL